MASAQTADIGDQLASVMIQILEEQGLITPSEQHSTQKKREQG